jgi:hypothetical protein
LNIFRRPFRRASTRILNALQNGRLLSLRTKNTINSSGSDYISSKAESLITKEQNNKKLSIIFNEKKIIEPNKFAIIFLKRDISHLRSFN